MKDKEIVDQYFAFIDSVVTKYKNHTFVYTPPVSSGDPELKLVGRQGFCLEFINIRNQSAYVSLEKFLDSMVEIPQTSTEDNHLNKQTYEDHVFGIGRE